MIAAAAPASSITSRWRALVRRFEELRERERGLVIAALAGLSLMLADALWLGPALAGFKAAQGRQAQARSALDRVGQDLQAAQRQGSAQLRQQQADLKQWRQRVREGDVALRSHEDALVGADRMVELLEQLLARHGELRVRALRSLDRTDLLATAPSPGAAPGAAASATPAPATLYRHGVELVVEGSYADLLSYLQAMEALPQRLLWGGITLKVAQYPKVVLTLRVFTISRERHWLEI
jgi:MSHA biogenesis protein MshJ